MAYQFDVLAPDRRVFLGEDKRLEFSVYDQGQMTDEELDAAITAGTAVPLDVAGLDFVWILRLKDKTGEPPLIEKSTGSPGGITVEGVFDADPQANEQILVVTLEDTDSYDPDAEPPVVLKPRKYRHSLKQMDDGFETVAAFGAFQFLQATAR